MDDFVTLLTPHGKSWECLHGSVMVLLTPHLKNNVQVYEMVSLRMVVLNSIGIDKECMECRIFACLEIHLIIRFNQKNQLKRTGTAIIMFYICLTKRNVDYFDL